MSPSENRQFWQEALRLQSESGQTVKAFCESEGIPEHRYYYWRKRLLDDESNSSEPEFVPVSFPDNDTVTKIVIRVGCFQIEVQSGFDPGVLGKVLETASGVKC